MTTQDIAGLVERLRKWTSPFECHHGAVYALADDAASALEHLAGENARLRAALECAAGADDLVIADTARAALGDTPR